MFKLKRMIWAGHVARKGENMNAFRISVGRSGGKNHWKDKDVGG
jgi:hypothetical protein